MNELQPMIGWAVGIEHTSPTVNYYRYFDDGELWWIIDTSDKVEVLIYGEPKQKRTVPDVHRAFANTCPAPPDEGLLSGEFSCLGEALIDLCNRRGLNIADEKAAIEAACSAAKNDYAQKIPLPIL